MPKTLLLTVGLGGLVMAAIALLHESPEDEALKRRAIQEVELRISPTSAFNATSVQASRSFYGSSCLGSRDWDSKIGLTEMIDVTSPAPKRAQLDFCLNTKTWEIRFDNELAAASLVDDTKYLNAQEYCFHLTDAANKVRYAALSATYGKVFLKVRPDDEDTSASSFSCTSYFDLHPTSPLPAVWILLPNANPVSDRPLTPIAVAIEEKAATTKSDDSLKQ